MADITRMKHPRTAIIVLSYNGLDITKKFLKDLYANTENFLLIIIDNGSTDGSADYLGSFAAKRDNVVFEASDTNLGVINGRNHGFQMYLGLEDKPEYVCFLDNDQFVQKGWLEHHHAVLEQSGCDIVGVEAWLLDKNLKPVEQCKRFGGPWSYIGCGGMLMKAAIPEKIGLFDQQFNPCYFEDPDFCYDKQTQIMTRDGLKFFPDITIEDEILTLSDDGIIEYQHPTRVIKKHEKNLLHFCNRRVDIMCTPEQKLLVGYTRPACGADKGEYREIDFIPAGKINDRLRPNESRHFIRTAMGSWSGEEPESILFGGETWSALNFAEFMGWYLSEGYTNCDLKRKKQRRDNQIRIGQYKDGNRAEIADCVERCGYRYRDDGKSVTFYDQELSHALMEFGKSYEKFVPSVIKNGSIEMIETFLRAYIKGDGSEKPNGFSIVTSSNNMKDDLVEMLIKTGRPFAFSLQNGGPMEFENGIYDCRPCWQIQSYCNKQGNDNTRAFLPKGNDVEYDDFVYDVTVPNHRIYIIRNGKGCWSSNCFRALKEGYKLAWNYRAKLIHLPHQTLGKNPNRVANFMSSYNKFASKWKGQNPRELRQFPIPLLKAIK